MKAQDILPDHADQVCINGEAVRKGTVGAFLANARVLLDPQSGPAARDAARQDLMDALPALQALGLFDILQLRDEGLRAAVADRLAVLRRP